MPEHDEEERSTTDDHERPRDERGRIVPDPQVVARVRQQVRARIGEHRQTVLPERDPETGKRNFPSEHVPLTMALGENFIDDRVEHGISNSYASELLSREPERGVAPGDLILKNRTHYFNDEEGRRKKVRYDVDGQVVDYDEKPLDTTSSSGLGMMRGGEGMSIYAMGLNDEMRVIDPWRNSKLEKLEERTIQRRLEEVLNGGEGSMTVGEAWQALGFDEEGMQRCGNLSKPFSEDRLPTNELVWTLLAHSDIEVFRRHLEARYENDPDAEWHGMTEYQRGWHTQKLWNQRVTRETVPGGTTWRHHWIHHSSAFRGDPLRGAGEIRVEDGVVKKINNSSGHYMPDQTSLYHTVMRFIPPAFQHQVTVGMFVQALNEQRSLPPNQQQAQQEEPVELRQEEESDDDEDERDDQDEYVDEDLDEDLDDDVERDDQEEYVDGYQVQEDHQDKDRGEGDEQQDEQDEEDRRKRDEDEHVEPKAPPAPRAPRYYEFSLPHFLSYRGDPEAGVKMRRQKRDRRRMMRAIKRRRGDDRLLEDGRPDTRSIVAALVETRPLRHVEDNDRRDHSAPRLDQLTTEELDEPIIERLKTSNVTTNNEPPDEDRTGGLSIAQRLELLRKVGLLDQ